MSLARLFSPLSQVLIRRLGDTGGPRADQVSQELDNLIAWAKLSPRRIKFDTSTVGNVGTGLDVLHTYSLDTPNRLLTDGDELIVWYGGNFAANDNDKRIQAFFGGTAYETLGALIDIDGATGWNIQARIIRLSSSSVRVNHTMIINTLRGDSPTPPNMNTDGGGSVILSRTNDIGGLTLNGAITMEVKGETSAASNNDVIQNMSSIWLIQQ